MTNDRERRRTLQDLLSDPNVKVEHVLSESQGGIEEVTNPRTDLLNAMAEAESLSSRAMEAFHSGDFAAAESFLLNSLSIERRLNMKSRMAADYGNLGTVYLEMGDLNAAEEAIQKSLELGTSKSGQARNYYWYAHLQVRRRNLRAAEEMAKKSMQLASGADAACADSARELHEWIMTRPSRPK